MKRIVTTGAALLALLAVVATVGAATSKPYIGVWKAKVTKAQLLDQGIVDPRMPGQWKLIFQKDGTYKTYNPLDRWGIGQYAAGPTRLVLRNDSACLVAGLKGPGAYRWSLKAGQLKLTQTSFGSDPCGGRTQTLTIPLWTRG